ncbi:MAG: hypothetical protein U9P12_04820, partial [Verrucomicrobiota bacterium]|nr:hypothetical protein [Verrucomicrobiota bacterium]
SHSCLWDQCRAYDSFWEARHRGPGHGLTSAHGVYWNTSGSGTAYPTKLVVTEQGRYGYVIGTSGGIDAVVSIDPALNNTAPADHVEGEGLGGTLFPPSLYLDQLARRLGLSGSTVVVVSTDPSDSDSTLAVDLFVDADGTVSTPGSGMAVSGLARELGTRNGTVSFMFDAMKNVSTNLATRGEKLLDGNIYRDSLGKIAVLGEPGGYGLGADAVNREGLAFSMDASSGMDASVNVRISAITVEWFGNGDALTVVNLVTKESLEWVGSIGTNPSFDLDVSSLNLSIQGGEAGGVASIYAHEDSNFRVSGVNIVLTEPTSISFGGSHHTGSSFVLNLKLQGVIPNGVDLYRATDLGGLWESIATDYAGTNYIDTALPTHPAVFYRAGRAMP